MTNYERIRLEELYEYDSIWDYISLLGWSWAWWS
jgi:hypothetical protein